MTLRASTPRSRLVIMALLAATAIGLSAQTRITPPPNKYSLADDVKLGAEAAAQVRKELPLMDDRPVDDWVERVGRRLVTGIPPELQHPEFRYTFEQVNQKEINAFALPGGPMFLNRGMIEASHSEGEVAGVMAHEMSHVVLRHGTAQATKGRKFQIGAVAGQILGAIVGGTAGSVISQGSQFGLGTYLMKYSREYETQADLMGSQMMARAGYDPREMANMFKTIETEGGSSGPQWLSSHPNPGNRYQRITKEAQSLRVVNPVGDTGDFQKIQARLRGMSPAYTAQQIEQMQKSGGVMNAGGGAAPAPAGAAGVPVRVAAPSDQYRTYQVSTALRVSVPSNWNQHPGTGAMTYAPDGAYVQAPGGGTAFTHGVEVGVVKGTGDLARDMQQLLRSFASSNPQLRQVGQARNDTVGGRAALTAQLENVSSVSGQPEAIQLSTTRMRDGNTVYVVGVAPAPEATLYNSTFNRLRQGIQITDK